MTKKVRRDTEPVLADALRVLGGCDHVDAVAVDVAPGTTAIGFTALILASPPRWTRSLLAVRDLLVAPFGLKGSRSGAVRIEEGAQIGPMYMFDVSDEQVVAGKDDKHLSFRTTFVVREGANGLEGVCTTVVRYHRTAGRLYFRAIEPFHHVIMRTLARRAAAA
ncbi:DUF2867 domain-containing protein [Streptomyces sp. H10-C2]|uniref:DUF2867 domain-containing protein n=1 Tax=unclassified Streptomyces TaxID=2593676 RepID=UPI0024BBB626|nr:MULTISPECIES: DUF2867 domain-containing protein [unclassified Streptomyces]MDJ0343646.1 DUF2867 domain-containing protein [Streptomyces sp. PH10-H1]MDJ0373106.1 DUF2867 domain-containing protein [Streptomyces sp. H10-C2]